MILLLLFQLLLTNSEKNSFVTIDKESIHYNKTDIKKFKINKTSTIKLNLIDKLDSESFDHASISERLNDKNILISKADFSYVTINDDLTKTYGYLPRGKGPGEIMEIMHTSTFDNSIVIVDNTIGKIMHYIEKNGELKFLKEEINEDVLKNRIINFYFDEKKKTSIVEKAKFNLQISFERSIDNDSDKLNYDLFLEQVDAKKYLPKVAYTLAFYGKIKCHNDKFYKIYDRLNLIEIISVKENNKNIIYVDESETRKLRFDKGVLLNKEIITLDFTIHNNKIYSLVLYSDKNYGIMEYKINNIGEIDISKINKTVFIGDQKVYRIIVVLDKIYIVDFYNNIYEI